jgi:hypothetical protein
VRICLFHALFDLSHQVLLLGTDSVVVGSKDLSGFALSDIELTRLLLVDDGLELDLLAARDIVKLIHLMTAPLFGPTLVVHLKL